MYARRRRWAALAGRPTPERLFAAGYAACFHSALKATSKQHGVEIVNSAVTAEVGIGPDDAGGFGLAITLNVERRRRLAGRCRRLSGRAPGARTRMRRAATSTSFSTSRLPDPLLVASSLSRVIALDSDDADQGQASAGDRPSRTGIARRQRSSST
ncbi:OsmC family protein [Aeromicrobium sp. UC242_57]|uniref:OsmC family protein n=1 Tax=Aeromicrobium sp. UC242_57 TaxID=3374624 RepID=UPI0037B79E89